MWKKITYYVCMVVLTVIFILGYFISLAETTVSDYKSKNIKNENYYNLVRYDFNYVNCNEVYKYTLNDGCVIAVYETANESSISIDNNTYNHLDYGYSIVIINDNFDTLDRQVNGVNINKRGIKLGDYNYYNNKFTDGVIVSESHEDYETNHNIYGDYDLYYDFSSYNYLIYYIPYDFVSDYAKINSFDSLELINPLGEVDFKIEYSFDFNSNFFDSLTNIKFLYNTASVENKLSEDDFTKIFAVWEENFLSNDNYYKMVAFSSVLGAKFIVKVVLMLICIILIVLFVGDILVGKRRTIQLFNKIKGKMNDRKSNTIDAETKVVNDDVKEE